MSGKKDGKASFLDQLEDKVHAAAEQIQALREENRKLTARVEELKNASSDSEGWDEERQEIRERVERLTGRLESLLDEEGAGS